jgi:hypothetical protein
MVVSPKHVVAVTSEEEKRNCLSVLLQCSSFLPLNKSIVAWSLHIYSQHSPLALNEADICLQIAFPQWSDMRRNNSHRYPFSFFSDLPLKSGSRRNLKLNNSWYGKLKLHYSNDIYIYINIYNIYLYINWNMKWLYQIWTWSEWRHQY